MVLLITDLRLYLLGKQSEDRANNVRLIKGVKPKQDHGIKQLFAGHHAKYWQQEVFILLDVDRTLFAHAVKAGWQQSLVAF